MRRLTHYRAARSCDAHVEARPPRRYLRSIDPADRDGGHVKHVEFARPDLRRDGELKPVGEACRALRKRIPIPVLSVDD